MVAQPLHLDWGKCHSLGNSRRHSHCDTTITFGVKDKPLHTYETNHRSITLVSDMAEKSQPRSTGSLSSDLIHKLC